MAALRSEIEELRRKEQKYMEEKEDSENEFGKKRALFRELYMTREGIDYVRNSRLEKYKRGNSWTYTVVSYERCSNSIIKVGILSSPISYPSKRYGT